MDFPLIIAVFGDGHYDDNAKCGCLHFRGATMKKSAEKVWYLYDAVSLDRMSNARQAEALKRYAKEHPGNWRTVSEKASGKDRIRPKFVEILELVKLGVVAKIVVLDADRLGRSAIQILQAVETCKEHGCELFCIKMGCDLTSPMAFLAVAMAAAIAQVEREIMCGRTKDQMHSFKRKGAKYGGARTKGHKHLRRATASKRDTILREFKARKSITEIAKILGMGWKTVARVVDKVAPVKETLRDVIRRIKPPPQDKYSLGFAKREKGQS